MPGVTRCPPGSAAQDRNTHAGTLAGNRRWGEIETRCEQSCVYIACIKRSNAAAYFKIHGYLPCGARTRSTQVTWHEEAEQQRAPSASQGLSGQHLIHSSERPCWSWLLFSTEGNQVCGRIGTWTQKLIPDHSRWLPLAPQVRKLSGHPGNLPSERP